MQGEWLLRIEQFDQQRESACGTTALAEQGIALGIHEKAEVFSRERAVSDHAHGVGLIGDFPGLTDWRWRWRKVLVEQPFEGASAPDALLENGVKYQWIKHGYQVLSTGVGRRDSVSPLSPFILSTRGIQATIVHGASETIWRQNEGETVKKAVWRSRAQELYGTLGWKRIFRSPRSGNAAWPWTSGICGSSISRPYGTNTNPNLRTHGGRPWAIITWPSGPQLRKPACMVTQSGARGRRVPLRMSLNLSRSGTSN